MAIKEELIALADEMENESWNLNVRWLSDKAEELRSIADRLEE